MTGVVHKSIENPSPAAILRKGVRQRLKPMRKLSRAIVESQDAEALHDLRVASRRLRTALLLMGSFVSHRHIKPIARRLKQLTRALGLPRELDVHVEHLNRLHENLGAVEASAAAEFLLERVAERRAREHREMLKALKSLPIVKLQKDIQALTRRLPRREVSGGVGRSGDEILAPLIEHAFAGLSALRQTERPEDLHQMRIAVKRLRYALEWIAPTARGGFAIVIHRAVALQDCIGRHHDATQLLRLIENVKEELIGRGRTALAEGLQHCRDTVAMERDQHYAEFLAMTQQMTASAIHRDVRSALEFAERRATIAKLRRVGT